MLFFNYLMGSKKTESIRENFKNRQRTYSQMSRRTRKQNSSETGMREFETNFIPSARGGCPSQISRFLVKKQQVLLSIEKKISTSHQRKTALFMII